MSGRYEHFPTEVRPDPAKRCECKKNAKASCQKHLITINDEMYSLSRMVDGDRYGIDIVRQISAVRDGLERVRDELRRETRGAVSLLPS
jgi:hypothetical protein